MSLNSCTDSNIRPTLFFLRTVIHGSCSDLSNIGTTLASFLSIHYMYIFGFDLIVCEVEREIHLNGLATLQNPLQWSWSLSKNESGLVEQKLESALIFFQAAWWKLALLNNHISKPFLRSMTCCSCYWCSYCNANTFLGNICFYVLFSLLFFLLF